MFPGGNSITCMVYHMIRGLDVYYADPAQRLVKTGYGTDDLDHELCELSVRRVQSPFSFFL